MGSWVQIFYIPCNFLFFLFFALPFDALVSFDVNKLLFDDVVESREDEIFFELSSELLRLFLAMLLLWLELLFDP